MKNISIWAINHIKICQSRIFEAEDDDFINKKKVRANERAIDHYLRYQSEEDKKELLSVINWTNDNCIEELKQLGWNILKGY